jgi:cyclase
MDFNRIESVSKLSRLPIIASGGASSMIDFHKAIQIGASAVAAGAIFQFTEMTPGLIRNYLAAHDVPVRILG